MRQILGIFTRVSAVFAYLNEGLAGQCYQRVLFMHFSDATANTHTASTNSLPAATMAAYINTSTAATITTLASTTTTTTTTAAAAAAAQCY